MKVVTLNGKKYHANDDEFVIYNHSEYTSLSLRPQLGFLERELGLINELIKIYDAHFINIGVKCSGYIPINVQSSHKTIVTGGTVSHSLNKNIILHNATMTIVDTLPHLDNDTIYLLKYDQHHYKVPDKDNVIIVSYTDLQLNNHHKYPLNGSDIILYIPQQLNNKFHAEFRYYFDGDKFMYDNLINLCIMVKDAGNDFENVLRANLPYVDQWTFLDTGSTDNTIKIINKVMKNKKGTLYCEPFINFRDSRNRCLELAGQVCKYNIMLDDTYILQGDIRGFLTEIRSDQYATSYNIFIKSTDMMYGSNRITRSADKRRYKFRIHEIINPDANKLVVQIPFEIAWVNDLNNDYMTNRTKQRKSSDVKLLKEEIKDNPDEPRHLYYLAQTYNDMREWDKAVKYYKKRTEHPVEGYREEVTDSYLLWAFYGNEKLNWSWNKCEKIYIKCFEHDKRRPDALFFIGSYYLNNDNYKAYQYLKQGFELGTPQNVTANLRPNLYNQHLPASLIPLCFKFKDYQLGEQACERLLTYTQDADPTMISYYKIFNLLNKNKKVMRKSSDKPILCFVADGGFNKWQGSSINNIGVGGSETYIIEMSRHIAKLTNFDVYVFCNCTEEIFQGVQYKQLDTYVDFINRNKVHTSIISRFSEYTHVTLSNDIDNVYLVVHDLLPSGNILPTDKRLRAIFCMSEWHKSHFLEAYPMFENRVQVFPNGVNIKDYQSTEKKLNSFIYSSFPNRGLLNLLRMFPKIRGQLPDATLDVFCDIKGDFVQTVSKNDMDKIEELLESQKEYVTNHGWVPKRMLQKYWQSAEFWLYPCTFMETFCITALEAAASGTLAITNDLAALQNTVADRGLVIKGDASTEEWQDTTIDKFMEILETKSSRGLIDKNRQWAQEYDWAKLAQRFTSEYLRIGEIIQSVDHTVNFSIDLYDNELVSNYIREYGFWELNASNVLMEIFDINPDILFIDAGANIGYYSLLAASKNVNVIAFEPIEENYKLFKNSINNNNFNERITLHTIALSDKDEQQSFNIYDSNMGLCSTLDYKDNIISRKEVVTCRRFDDYIDDLTKPMIVKIDVEKMEVNVLLGMEKLLQAGNLKYILIEISKDNVSQVYNLVKKHGFTTFYNIGFDREHDKNVRLTTTSYLADKKYISDIDTLLKMSNEQYNILLCKPNNTLDYAGMLNWSSDIPQGSKKVFEGMLDTFKDRKCNILEIGTYSGTSVINMLKYLPMATATVIDRWVDYEENKLLGSIQNNNIKGVFYDNLIKAGMKNRVHAIQGDSTDILMIMLKNSERYNFVYVDGSHKCLDCYTDMVLSWQLLLSGGIMAIDDYMWQPENSENEYLDRPYHAVNHFIDTNKDAEVLHKGYRVFLKKH